MRDSMSWKAATGVASLAGPRTGHRSIRGHISGPIPVPAPERTDDEFPMRDRSATLAAPRRGNDGGANDATPDPREPDGGLRQQPLDAALADSSRTEARRSDHKQDDATSAPPKHKAVAPKTDPALARGAIDGPQRRRTTFKSALSKLLGRNKKSGHAHMSQPPIKPALAESLTQHGPSDQMYQERSPKSPEQKRYASMPITEYDRALRSHSIGPEDVLAIQSARNSLNAETRQSGKKPDASDATLAHPAAPRWTEARRFTGLTPRPASSHDRRPRLADWSEDPNEIGRAITSDIKGLRRRSRSLSAFPTTDGAFLGVSRRRSDEIRHWRESYEPATADSLSSPAHQVDDAGPLAVDEHEATVVEEDQPKSPAQPFIFGDVSSMKEAAGLKITEAASLGSRVSILEMRMTRLEQLVTEVARSLPGSAPPTDFHAQADGAEHRSSAASTGHGNQQGTIPTRPSEAPKVTFGGDAQASPRSTVLLSHSTNSSASRPLSLVTVRGAFGSSLPQDASGAVATDHYLTLVSLLETERSAREVLESQVRRLGHQINLATKLAGYARPTIGEVPSADSSLGGTSAFDHDDEEEEGRWAEGNEEPSSAIIGLEGKAMVPLDEDEDGDAESCVTPNEDHDHDLSSSDDEKDTALRTAARALSLSRLTLGSSLQHPMHQAAPQAI
ncbi:hypothetical protein HRG_005644 [Hirsutella rhossiliensis]|uniref:Uncharacterized protein n=1 Tax=Hirsutella rhossiliensis TaxID=111463 RepID=A0A9P8MZF8_9HYPO|nr:uncharacterized protein HRG_05644 [Hirsutella rhossiliensis]KAH0963134.1 hypothetical protein HRG_05644 [Hirsutella rhossiliensis]